MDLSDYQLIINSPSNKLTPAEGDRLATFLHQHLDQYGDEKTDILKCISYAMKEVDSPGGFTVRLTDKGQTIGAVVINRTGMSGYIPENILVYIAVNNEYRGQGIGKHLMKTAIGQAEGDIALHVEADNPAKFLYEKLGFENKYLEMRLKKD